MLLKLNSANIVPNDSSTLNLTLLNNAGTTAIDTTDIASQTNVNNWFMLKSYNGSVFTSALTITAVAAGNTPTNGDVVITFSNNSSPVSVGDILVLAPGSVTPASGNFTMILNTTSLTTGFDSLTPTDTLTEASLAPKAYTTKDKTYNFKLDIITKQGTTISSISTQTDDPIIVNGIVVKKIVFDVTDADKNYNSLEQCNYTIEFFDIDNNPVEYEASANDIVSVSFIPAQ